MLDNLSVFQVGREPWSSGYGMRLTIWWSSFESQNCIMDGRFVTIICCKHCLFEINKEEDGVAHVKKYASSYLATQKVRQRRWLWRWWRPCHWRIFVLFNSALKLLFTFWNVFAWGEILPLLLLFIFFRLLKWFGFNFFQFIICKDRRFCPINRASQDVFLLSTIHPKSHELDKEM